MSWYQQPQRKFVQLARPTIKEPLESKSKMDGQELVVDSIETGTAKNWYSRPIYPMRSVKPPPAR
jgi:hypothetical protein